MYAPKNIVTLILKNLSLHAYECRICHVENTGFTLVSFLNIRCLCNAC